MSETDKFMQEEFLPFCKRVLDAFEQNHPMLHAAFNRFMSGTNLMGMRLTDHGNVLGDYTLVLEDAKISRIYNGVLSSEIHSPFGAVKPYYILEKSAVEKMIQDEPDFIAHPFATKFKYYPEITIKFLK